VGGRTGALSAGFAALLAAGLAAGCGASGSAQTQATIPHGPKVVHIVFPEGFTRAEMAQRITVVRAIAESKRHVHLRMTAKGYLAATRSSALPGRFAGDAKRRPLEGFLFPATYAFFSNEAARHFVRRQVDAFRTAWTRVDLRYASSKNLTPYDVLVIASMIEKETLAPDERRLVSAVIYNRLHAHMPLGIDATIRYALDIPGTQSLRVSELNNPTPYNTRIYAGLPPTPIANPGLASIQAAAHPAHVNYLYFVRKPDKIHHFFTASFREFQNYANAHGY